MNEQRLPASTDNNNSFSQYLSFHFYRDNLDSLKDKTKDSINNFLKSIAEIEEEFISSVHSQQMNELPAYEYGFDSITYMEENY